MKPLDSRIAWEGPAWRLRVDTLHQPDGTTTEKGIIEHPGSVVLIPMWPAAPEISDAVVMLQQFRPALAVEILELPAGTRGWDEPWLDCAQRELREETGYRAQEFIPLGQVWPAPGFTNELMSIYLATGLSEDPLPQDFDEEIKLHPMPLEEVVAMAEDGRLRDAKSAIAVLRLAAFLRQGR